MEFLGSALILVVGLVVAILLFLALREFFAWYWKVNLILEHLDVLVQQQNRLFDLLRQRLPGHGESSERDLPSTESRSSAE